MSRAAPLILSFALTFAFVFAFSLVSAIAQTAPEGDAPERSAPQSEAPMTPARLVAILQALDPEAGPAGGGIGLTLGDVPVLIFMDPRANRMRAMVPIASIEGLSEDDMVRILQANFDTALDARYAIANGRLFSTFIHPLAQLERDQLISGLAQTVTLAQTYGTLYSSGAAMFGGGDSGAIFQDLVRELQERGEEL